MRVAWRHRARSAQWGGRRLRRALVATRVRPNKNRQTASTGTADLRVGPSFTWLLGDAPDQDSAATPSRSQVAMYPIPVIDAVKTPASTPIDACVVDTTTVPAEFGVSYDQLARSA